MKHLFRLGLATGLLFGSAAVYAATDSPVGTWKTIDDATGKPKSIVQITEQNGELQGKVLQVLQSEEGPHPLCAKCDGERKNQPVEGMTIMWGVSRDDDVWDGGKILDPHNGKTYKVKLTLMDGGQKLDVHGYIGFAMLGRSQVWERQPDRAQ
jgi:uncharacterized protein (DUF2147 family)